MKQERSSLFDILKGAAILMVCITHFSWTDSERTELLFPFWISMAVPIFMIVTGYLTAASYTRKGYRLRDMYEGKTLLPKLRQFLRPFAMVFALELILELVMHHRLLPFHEVVNAFLTGGLGKYGTYYVPVLLQMLLIFPLIYTVLRNHRRGLVLCFLANLLFELSKDQLGVTKADYRLLAFRYVFLIAMGCYLYLENGRFPLRKYLPMLAVGIAYILLTSYTGHKPIIFTRWRTTSMMTAFYAAPIVALLLRFCRHVRLPLLEHMGQASYHIFLMQIIYYNYLRHHIAIQDRMTAMVVGVVLCLLSGYLFFMLDRELSALWKKRGKPVPVPQYHRRHAL